jgi:pimeloyl-ACP methyl ester carboxylesterase
MSGMDALWVRRPWGRLRVYLSGTGPAVLVLHGLGGSGRYWEGLAKELRGEATIIAPDLAGFGASDQPDVAYDRGFHLDNLDAVVAAVRVGSPSIVIGHSMGGILGALWAARHPEQVRSLALVASPFPKTRAPRPKPGGARRLAQHALRTGWPLLTLPYRSSIYPRGVIVDYVRHSPTSYWRTGYALIWDPTIVDELAPLRSAQQRRLLLYAGDDRQVPLSAQERWSTLLPGAQSQVVDHGGHQLLLVTHFEPLLNWIRA